jgi:hypothetical protein
MVTASSGIRAEFLSVYFRQRRGRGRKHSDTRQVVSERDFCLYIADRGERRRRQSY